MWNRSFFRYLIYFFIFISCAGCEQFGDNSDKKYRETRMLMGTIIHLDICSQDESLANESQVYRKIWERLEEIAWRMNVMDAKSDVAKINHSNVIPIEIPEDTYQVLQSAMHHSKTTGGAFDITVWPLIELWKQSEGGNTLPSEEAINSILNHVGSKNIQLLAQNQVKLLKKNTKIDLGGIAKGYAIDEAARIFRKHNMRDFFIDAGGDIYAGGNNCLGKSWRVGIRDPRNHSKIIEIVQISNQAVATSGNYERFFTIQNKQWSHILNPVRGYPQEEVISSTVIGPSAMDADALATALSVLGSQKGTGWMDVHGKSNASLIFVKDNKNKIQKFTSQNYSKFKVQ